MTTTYIKRVSLLICLAFSVIACDNKLDIQPRQSIDAETALNNEQNVESAVIGAYATLGGPALYGTNLNLIPELLASTDYVNWQGTFQGYRELDRKTITSINSEASRTWIDAYEGINTVNNVLEALPVVEDEDLRAQLEGEALFIRGILYFELVRLYALPWAAGTANSQAGVPLILTATKTEAQAANKVARSTVAQVYQQVIADLTRAESLLPEDNGTRADQFSAAAFLSRVYLQQGDYTNARDAANRVIESEYFRLNPSVTSAFRNRNTAESIFEIQQNDQNNAGTANDGLATFYASLPGIGRGDVRVLEVFAEQYDSLDARLNELIYEGTGRRAGRLRSGKWTDFGANIPIVRLAEMYLIRAEANVRLGTAIGDTPINDVNRIRLRAGVDPLVTATLEDILLERQLELAFEGLRVHDVKRTQGSTGDFAYNAPELVLPVPQRELDTNDQLVQNTGY
ncbi:RagB/SusD family nutrient uptake outer membrane protein [Rhodocytophaga aerolata]|uniref:RagB/SusD family nutrient uptake outer membrane protein n=1 Tax=Rhodocytophaga aerolata TaxID=455078 RepID=A0ABT8R1V0_9BACT|nr:RagB/SusD family nutrient uptake outer membrane protein [Rhodocytophaga aerolata]MDO1445359.1 RagB/SusD family nutrient uptake outer membrane protein [Rhodocytophaga aerolata]